jgi:hypothetical protein
LPGSSSGSWVTARHQPSRGPTQRVSTPARLVLPNALVMATSGSPGHTHLGLPPEVSGLLRISVLSYQKPPLHQVSLARGTSGHSHSCNPGSSHAPPSSRPPASLSAGNQSPSADAGVLTCLRPARRSLHLQQVWSSLSPAIPP